MWTLFEFAQRFIGMKEVPGSQDNDAVLTMLKLDGDWPDHDEVPWCSAFVNFLAWLLRLPRSKSLMARSWLGVGTPVDLEAAIPRYDIVIFKRGGGDQPGPDVLNAPGHVAIYAGVQGGDVIVIGGNQGNAVSMGRYPISRVLGVRRLRDG